MDWEGWRFDPDLLRLPPAWPLVSTLRSLIRQPFTARLRCVGCAAQGLRRQMQMVAAERIVE